MSTRPVLEAVVALLLLTAAGLPASGQSLDSTADTNTLVARGLRYLESGDYETAENVFKQVLAEGSDVEAVVGLARVALLKHNWTGAARQLEDALHADPHHVDAHYWNGIAQRELAKFQTLNQAHHWKTAEKEFRWVIGVDSAHRDVFYQYALLERYRGNNAEALRLGEKQLELNPDLAEVRKGVYTLYGHFIHHEKPKLALKHLENSPSLIARYFAGEVYRREGDVEPAERIFRDVLDEGGDIEPQPVLLSIARIRYSQERFAEAEAFVNDAVERIENVIGADLVFEDFKYVISEDELDLYRSLQSAEELKAFLRRIWVERDPMPARTFNSRLAEHYRRLLVAENDYVFDGFRLWHNDPDRLGQLAFPPTYALNEEFNDKGLIYIRHGEPDDREIQIGAQMDFRSVPGDIDPFYTPGEHFYAAGWRPNESWRYNSPEQMDFHFVLADGGANNWRLTPVLTNYEMLASREHWGPKYYQLARAAEIMAGIQDAKVMQTDVSALGVSAFDQELTEEEAARLDSASDGRSLNINLMDEHMRSVLEFQEVRDRIAEESRHDVALALTTEQHSWNEGTEPLEIPYVVSAFRGEDGQTNVEVDFALPLGRITEEAGASTTVDVEVGYSVHDELWRPVKEEAQTKHLPATPDPSAASIDFFRFTVPPGRYNLSLLGNPVSTVQLGGYKFAYEVPDFSGTSLSMSDILVADFIGPARSGSRFDRGELHISPNPLLRFSTAQPVFVYFEIYNLTLDADDRTNFSIEYVLKPERPRPKFLGLIGGGERPSVTITEEQSGDVLSPLEHAAIDVRNVDPGPYTLTVRVTDRVTGLVAERSRAIDLYRYEE